MTNWVHDYETLSNCFVGVFEDYKTDENKIFVVHKIWDDREALIQFLDKNVKEKEWHISFNGLAFDSQITEHIIQNKEFFMSLSAEEAARWIYKRAQNVITRQNEGEYAEYSEKNLSIRQLDIFKMNHWDNPQKRSSLKWIQYSMDWYNIQEMPIPHGTYITTREQIQQIIYYCINDVKSTKNIMNLSKDQINLRATLTGEYNIGLYSASEPRISKELFLHFLSKKTNMKKYDIKQLRTYRQKIYAKDIILPYVKFATPEFNRIFDEFKNLVIDPNLTKKSNFKPSMKYKGVKTDFGLGGVHGARSSGVYTSTDQMIIMSSDVVSFYPNLAIRNKWSPAHLPKEAFCELYEWFFDERKKISKKDVRNYVYKIILNSTFGLSIDHNSFLYDPQFGMQITVNGQLSLMMLYEMLCEEIPEAIPLMQNTDGLEMMIPVNLVDRYMKVCEEWEKITNLKLEHDQYQKLILADVNNYIAVSKYKEVSEENYKELKKSEDHDLFKNQDGKFYYASTKCKGRFEFKDIALHKNKSYLVIAKALFNYYVHDTRPEDYLKNNKNIFDYCAGVKIKSNWSFYRTFVHNGDIVYEDLQHTLRYFISKSNAAKIIKRNISDSREIQVESGPWLQKVFNVYEDLPWESYDINEAFYLDKIYREIDNIGSKPKSNQLSLF